MKRCLLFLFIFLGIASSATAQVQPTDTDGDGYINISTLYHLRWVSENSSSWESNYELDNNINAAVTYSWNSYYGFSPIGNDLYPFAGKFEGNGFTIDSLYIYRPTDNIGFIGMARGAEISNVKITNCRVYGRDNVGILLGMNKFSTINNCFSTGSALGMSYVGGLVGYNNHSTISDSYNSGSVNGKKDYVGGLVAYNSNSMVSNSYNTGSVYCWGNYVGGLIGDNNEHSTVSNCYNSGMVRGLGNFVGGLVACNNDHSTVSNCYNSYDVEGKGYYVGGLVAYNHYSTVSNSYNTGSVKGQKKYLGGLVAYNHLSNITNCYSTGNISDSYIFVGGLVGCNYYSNISNSYSMGNVSGSEEVGGLVGANSTSSKITNCYSMGNVTGKERVGGLIGYNYFSSKVTNCYSIGKAYGEKKIGGLVGENHYDSKVNTSFWDTQTSGIDSSATGTPKTTAEMKAMLTFASVGWNFRAIWSINPTFNNGYPYISTSELISSYGIEPIDIDGDGYRNISCYSHLHWVSSHASSWAWNFELDNNINADSARLLSGGFGFFPIGNDLIQFTGKFEGNGFAIDSLYINRPVTEFIGLFGKTSKAEISNVGITNCRVIGNNSVGGLVGLNNDNSIVSNSYSTGSIFGHAYVGGLVGENWLSSTVSKCYSTISVSGNHTLGGLVGDNKHSSTVSNCYSTGSVSGTGSIIGGFLGMNYNNSTVSNSYSTGSVTGNNNIGGLVGVNSKSTVSNCFWDLQTSEIDSSAGGTGKTTYEMKIKLTFTNAGWNFDSTWAIAADYNDGYPNLDGKNGPDGIKEIYSGSLIYPQPASNELFVRLSETSNESAKIKLYDQTGLLALAIETNANDGVIRLNTSALASGVYHVLINIDGKNYSAKVVVAK